MTVKEWLNRGYRIDSEINQLILEKDKAFAMATNTVTESGAERVQTSKANSSEIRFINYAAYEELINERIDELYNIKCEISSVIRAIKDITLRQLLFMRYISFMKWEDIAEELGFTPQWVHVLHKRALRCVEKILDKIQTVDCN